MINLSANGASLFRWSKEYLVNVLTEGKNPIVTNPLLINALLKIDRSDFVPEKFKDRAYDDVEIELGYNESLSKPTTIAYMLSLLNPELGKKYLDIGSGTGYSAAVLGFIAGEAGHVYTIERVQWLWEKARENLSRYKDLKNIDVLYRDGIVGLPNHAPFDGIHIAFALNEIPDSLKQQLKVRGGRLVVPTDELSIRIIERTGIDTYEEELVEGIFLGGYKAGIA